MWVWTATRGLARDGYQPQYGTTDPSAALDFIDSMRGPGLFVFADVHHALGNPLVVRYVKELAQRQTPGRTIVLTAPERSIPQDLVGVALPWSLRPPGPDELQRLVRRTIDDLRRRRVRVQMAEPDVARLAGTLRGLCGGARSSIV